MKKTVLITGASGDLGGSLAIEFAKKDYNVIIHYFTNKNRALELEEKLKETYNTNTLVVNGNLSSEEDVVNIFKEITKKFKKVDVLVNNAAVANDTVFFDKKEEDFIKVYKTNLIGPYLTSKYVSPMMLEEKQGVIINISSTNAENTYYSYSADYDASKAALNSLSKNLAVQLSPYVRVVTVAPGWINTQMNKELDKDYIEEEQEKILLKRFAEPTEIAKVVTFLASDDACYINNTIITVDGGMNG